MKTLAAKRQEFVAEVQCDRCAARARHDAGNGFNNHLLIEFDASWGSSIDDGKHVEIDLCHSCLVATLGPWLRVSSSDWARGIDVEALDPPPALD